MEYLWGVGKMQESRTTSGLCVTLCPSRSQGLHHEECLVGEMKTQHQAGREFPKLKVTRDYWVKKSVWCILTSVLIRINENLTEDAVTSLCTTHLVTLTADRLLASGLKRECPRPCRAVV